MTSLILAIALAGQFPSQPDKQLPQAAAPSKTTPQPLASPQVQASPQQSYNDVPEQAPIVLRAIPRSYAVSRVIVQAAPVQYQQTVLADLAPACQVAYAGTGCGVGVQNQVVVQRGLIGHQAQVSHGLQSAQVNHGLIGAGVGRQPKKIKTKQVTRVKRGLFGR